MMHYLLVIYFYSLHTTYSSPLHHRHRHPPQPLTYPTPLPQWRDTDFSTQWCFENFIQHRSLKRARDIREQLEGLMERVEIEIISSGGDTVPIRKVTYPVYCALCIVVCIYRHIAFPHMCVCVCVGY